MSRDDDWYRRTTWTPDDQVAFRARNRRSRSADGKAQYIRIQATTLFETERPELTMAALSLVQESLQEYPNAMDLALALELAGKCCWRLGRHDAAMEYFHAALRREADFPGIVTNACFHMGKLAVEHRMVHEYDAVLRAMEAFGAPVFPWHVYIAEGVRAIVASDRGDQDAAQDHAARALRASGVKDSGLGYGRGRIGIVTDQDTPFRHRLEGIAASRRAP